MNNPITHVTKTFSLANETGQDILRCCIDLADSVCTSIHASPDDTYAVRLAVEEACANIIDHGYPKTAPGPISLSFSLADDTDGHRRLSIQIRDKAPPFSPDMAPSPDLDADLDERKIGGLGWFLIRQMMDELKHTSANGENCLDMTKILNKADRP